MKSVLTSLRSRKLDASIVLDGVIPHAAIKLFNLLGVPGSALKSLLARLIQDNMRDVHRLFTLHKVFTLRIWTQAGVAFRSLPDNLTLAPCDLCGVACRFRAKVQRSHAGPVELLQQRVVDAWLVHVDKPKKPGLRRIATTLANYVGVRVCLKCALPVLEARYLSIPSSDAVPQHLAHTPVTPSPFQSPLSSRSTSGTSASRWRPPAPEPTPSQTVASTDTSRQSPCPSGDRSLQSPVAPRRSPRIPSRSASRDSGTQVSSLLTAAVVSLQGFASREDLPALGRAVVYELRARAGLSSNRPLLNWVPSSEAPSVCDRWRAHNYSLVGAIFTLDGNDQQWQVVRMAPSRFDHRQHPQILAVPFPSRGFTMPTTLELRQARFGGKWQPLPPELVLTIREGDDPHSSDMDISDDDRPITSSAGSCLPTHPPPHQQARDFLLELMREGV